MSIGRAMDRAYILNTIKEAGRQKEASSGCSAGLDRLQKKAKWTDCKNFKWVVCKNVKWIVGRGGQARELSRQPEKHR